MPQRVQRVLASVPLGEKLDTPLPPSTIQAQWKIQRGRKQSFHSNPHLQYFTDPNLPPQAQVSTSPISRKDNPAASLTRFAVMRLWMSACWMRWGKKKKRRKKRVSAWVRLKTPTHAEPCHTHIRVMDESCGLHNLWAARHIRSAALLNVALPVSAPLPLRARWRLSVLTDWRGTGPKRRRVLPDWDEHLLSQSGLLALRERNLPCGD